MCNLIVKIHIFTEGIFLEVLKMVWFKYNNVFHLNNDLAFDTIHHPSQSVPHSGIYKCDGCNHEIAANENDPFPPQNHHQHNVQQGSIRWKLVAATQN